MGAPHSFSRGSRVHSIKARAFNEQLKPAPAPAVVHGASTPSAPLPFGKRGASRLRLSIPARLISRYATHDCLLIDLSSTGAQVGLNEPFDQGETVILQIGGIEAFGEVVRCVRNKYGGVNGVCFDPAIGDGDVLKVRSHAETYEREDLRAMRTEVRKWVEGEI